MSNDTELFVRISLDEYNRLHYLACKFRELIETTQQQILDHYLTELNQIKYENNKLREIIKRKDEREHDQTKIGKT